MRAINRKLWRDLFLMRGMVLVIALMITCGAATYITFLSTLDSLQQTQQTYYQDYSFGHIFASLKRAPRTVLSPIREIEGVNRVEPRIQALITLEVAGYGESVTGMVISLPEEREPLLNQLYLREGRLPAAYSENEILLGDGFAEAHGLATGDRLQAVINGRQRMLTVVGIGLSPEYIYQGKPGEISPDLHRFALLWMRRTPLEAAYDMKGAFNNITLSLAHRAHTADVIERLDQVLRPYGGRGAVERKNQNSHFFITEEFRQLSKIGTIIPTIFIVVAAFLLNVVIGRLIRTQRGQIAILKAFGYSNREVGLHYLLLVSVIVVIGLAGGVGLGYYLGGKLSGLYADFYRFPYLHFKLSAADVWAAVFLSMSAAYGGVFLSVREAVKLPPAEAMRPETPGLYRQSLPERWGLASVLDPPTKMILRQMSRQPVKVAFGIIGVAFGASLMIIGRMSNDSVKYLVEKDFRQSQQFDLGVTFDDVVSEQVLREMRRMPGVYYVEGYRSVAVRMIHGHGSYLTSIEGFPPDMRLRVLNTRQGTTARIPRGGILLTQTLAEILHARIGDVMTVEFLDGSQRMAAVPVAGYAEQYFGLAGYMDYEQLDRLVTHRRMVSGAYLQIDRSREAAIVEDLKKSPYVGEIMAKQKLIEQFYESTAQTWLIMALFIALFAGATVFSVIYNNARISLSERSRELASLRVLGLRRGEIAYILLGELALIVLLALPIGFLLGWGLTYFIIWSLQTELYRIPMHITSGTYALATVVILVSALLSGAVIWRKIRRLDLIAVLKTRE